MAKIQIKDLPDIIGRIFGYAIFACFAFFLICFAFLLVLSPILYLNMLDSSHSIGAYILAIIATFFLVLLVLPTLTLCFSESNSDKIWQYYGRVCGKIWKMFPDSMRSGVLDLVSWLKSAILAIVSIISALFNGGAKAVLWLLGAAVVMALAYAIFQVIALLPISLAIVIGALIIASAIAR